MTMQMRIPARTMVVGAGHFEGLFWAEDWPKVEKWLSTNGFKNGPTEPEDIADDWAGYEQMGG